MSWPLMPRRATGADLQARVALTHPRPTVCPGCEEDCCHTGLPQLVYTFETCECQAAATPHLTEQIWHRACLVAGAA